MNDKQTYRDLIEIVMRDAICNFTMQTLNDKLAGNNEAANEGIANCIDMLRASLWLLKLPKELCEPATQYEIGTDTKEETVSVINALSVELRKLTNLK